MTPQEIEVARRAVACKGWRWMPGMVWIVPPSGAPDDDGDSGSVDYATFISPRMVEGWLPDLTDSATRGCLLKLVREAWNDPGLAAVGRWTSKTGWMWHVTGGKPHGGTFNRMSEVYHDAEATALVVALETARALSL